MARSQNAFDKKQKEKARLQKKKAKQQRKEERQANAQDGTLENMMAYVDEYGNILDTPPGETKKEETDASEIEIGIPKKEDTRNAERRGRVSYFDNSKGYGFISQDGSQERYFVHMNNLKMPIKEGDKVSFKAQKGQRGMDAIEVTVL